MCIICFKPAGVKMPSKYVIQRCEISNPDGFGFATPTKFYKTMCVDAFNEHLASISKDEPAIIHCRIATHGSLKKANCHPFNDPMTGVSFAHNGILHTIDPIGDKTDSETAFLTRFVPVIRKYGIDSEQLEDAVAEVIGASKFAFIDPSGDVELFGHWVDYGDGCLYSHYPW